MGSIDQKISSPVCTRLDIWMIGRLFWKSKLARNHHKNLKCGL